MTDKLVNIKEVERRIFIIEGVSMGLISDKANVRFKQYPYTTAMDREKTLGDLQNRISELYPEVKMLLLIPASIWKKPNSSITLGAFRDFHGQDI